MAGFEIQCEVLHLALAPFVTRLPLPMILEHSSAHKYISFENVVLFYNGGLKKKAKTPIQCTTL
jgi:hypothetical protein